VPRRPAGRRAALGQRPGRHDAAVRPDRPKKGCCGCGQALPLLERCTFTFASERSIDYLIGQCPTCKAIYWQEAPVAEPSFDW